MVFVKENLDWGSGEEFLGPRHFARLRKIISLLPKEKTIFLDGAVGLGILSEKLKKKGFLPVGIDLDFGAAKHSKDKGIFTLQGNLEALPFKDDVFPLIISSETLEHLKDHKKAVNEFYRVAKDSGNLIISVPINERFWSYWDEWAGHKKRFSPKNIDDDFKPFKIEKKVYFGFPFVFLYDLIFLKKFIKKRGEGKLGRKRKKIFVFLKKIFHFPLIILFSINIPLKNYSPLFLALLKK